MTPHKNTRRAAALVATAAMVVVGVQTASAATAHPHRAGDPPTPPRRRACPRAPPAIKSAQADATSAAGTLGLGAKEKLVVKDVVKDADGTTHTRYERTYAGLPVLGGDLVVAPAEAGTAHGRHQGDRRRAIKVADHHAEARHRPPPSSRPSPPPRPTAREDRGRRAPRKVVWAGAAASRSSPGRPSSAASSTTARPSELHVVTDATTGKKLYEYQGIETGTGNTPVQRHGHARHHPVGIDVPADRRRRAAATRRTT